MKLFTSAMILAAAFLVVATSARAQECAARAWCAVNQSDPRCACWIGAAEIPQTVVVERPVVVGRNESFWGGVVGGIAGSIFRPHWGGPHWGGPPHHQAGGDWGRGGHMWHHGLALRPAATKVVKCESRKCLRLERRLLKAAK